jgi:hypothetical protein
MNPTQRDHLMAALSAAEHLVSVSPQDPAHIRIDSEHFWGNLPGTGTPRIGVLLYFHTDQDAIGAFAEVAGVDVTEQHREYKDSDPHSYVYADGEHEGVRFRAWTLVDAPAPAPDAHLRECQLAEQHHQIDDPAEPDPAQYIAVLPLTQSPLAVAK